MLGLIEAGVDKNKLGVGFQMHISINWDADPDNPDSDHNAFQERIDQLNSEGIDVHITELDVRIPEPVTTNKLNDQAKVYEDVLKICHEAPNCKAFVMWGFTDRYSWVPENPNTFEDCKEIGCGSALIFDELYQPKKAYEKIRDILSQLNN